jgi:hypothetical protein
MPEEKERGLMNWYDKGNSVDEKVRSAFMSVEGRDGELVGVITAKIYGQLTEEELEEFRLYCEGQLSDGVGESLEQRPIKMVLSISLDTFYSNKNYAARKI